MHHFGKSLNAFQNSTTIRKLAAAQKSSGRDGWLNEADRRAFGNFIVDDAFVQKGLNESKAAAFLPSDCSSRGRFFSTLRNWLAGRYWLDAL